MNVMIEGGREIKETDKCKYLGLVLLKSGRPEDESESRLDETRKYIKHFNAVLWEAARTIHSTMVRTL